MQNIAFSSDSSSFFFPEIIFSRDALYVFFCRGFSFAFSSPDGDEERCHFACKASPATC